MAAGGSSQRADAPRRSPSLGSRQVCADGLCQPSEQRQQERVYRLYIDCAAMTVALARCTALFLTGRSSKRLFTRLTVSEALSWPRCRLPLALILERAAAQPSPIIVAAHSDESAIRQCYGASCSRTSLLGRTQAGRAVAGLASGSHQHHLRLCTASAHVRVGMD